jgi:hypothetical protein
VEVNLPPHQSDDSMSRAGTSDKLAAQPQKEGDNPSRVSNISIRNLLNDGRESFTKTFNLPVPSKPAGTTNTLPHEDAFESHDLFPGSSEYQVEDNTTASYFGSTSLVDLVDLVGTYEEFWNGPFPANSPSLDYELMNYTAALLASTSGDANLRLNGCEVEAGPPPTYISRLVDVMLTSIWTLDLDEEIREELTAAVHFLLTNARVSKFVSLYFLNWHLNCPILHHPSFDLYHTSTLLLLSVALFGAMYSKDSMELYATKRLLDIAEMAIFNSEVFSSRTEIARSISGTADVRSEIMQWSSFEKFQAGHLILVLQYWAGTRSSKNRAMESQFGKIIKVSHLLSTV